MTKPFFIQPTWPASPHIKALTTTRIGGFSKAPFDSLNLGTHVGDQADVVARNRQTLISAAHLPSPPLWLQQVHSTVVVNSENWQPDISADAIFSTQRNHVCAIMTADCLPLLLCDESGTQVAAAHAGWRGLLNGVIENTVKPFQGPRNKLLAWLGPAIGATQFEVGEEVFNAFTESDAKAHTAFIQTDGQHYLADIYALARQRLNALGIEQIYGGDHCTVSEAETFFSYRREGQTGRMASLIWIASK